MVEIIFEAHGTTFDNEAHLSSGHNDVALSPLGEKQSKEMGIRYQDDHFDAIFCSDLQRAYKSAGIGFGTKWPIIQDARLRECNYGDFTQHPSAEVDIEKPKRIHTPFPKGESYMQTTGRMKSFLADLLKDYGGKRVMIIGHRATQYGLDNLIDGVSLEQLTSSHFKWQPGWKYIFNKPFSTPQTVALSNILKENGVQHHLEYWDGHKHVDMFIPDAKLYIEIDGIQHYTDPKQFEADLFRDHFSNEEKYFTKHISNQLIETHLKQIAETIIGIAKKHQS